MGPGKLHCCIVLLKETKKQISPLLRIRYTSVYQCQRHTKQYLVYPDQATTVIHIKKMPERHCQDSRAIQIYIFVVVDKHQNLHIKHLNGEDKSTRQTAKAFHFIKDDT